MKLLLPHIIQILLEERAKLYLIPKILKAQKFIYESVSDSIVELVKPIHETSEEMIEWGIFHLPSPMIWVEDIINPDILVDLESSQIENMKLYNAQARHCYLAEEFEDRISIEVVKIVQMPPGHPRKWMCESYIREYGHKGNTIFLGKDRRPVPVEDSIGEAPFALRDLLVTLATPQAHKEVVTVSRHNETQPIFKRNYSHTVVRVKTTPSNPSTPSEPTGRRKAQEFVPGYVWGKHTRPRSQQKWINPYFRGDPALGRAKKKDHYEVTRADEKV